MFRDLDVSVVENLSGGMKVGSRDKVVEGKRDGGFKKVER
jgi:hypothetical protein